MGYYTRDETVMKFLAGFVAAFFVVTVFLPIRIPVIGVPSDTLELENQLAECNFTVRSLEHQLEMVATPPFDWTPIAILLSVLVASCLLSLAWIEVAKIRKSGLNGSVPAKKVQ